MGVRDVRLVVGMEVHVELATRRKMFTGARSPAHASVGEVEPNTLIDPVVLALPGALPVPNGRAIELSIAVGLALGCSIAEVTRFDRKGYFYPDLPKAYQISQFDQPLCFDGSVEVPAFNERGEVVVDGERTRIGIVRAHLEEDAGKLLHEAPGGVRIDHSIVDLNRAGTPLLEIVTAPDFSSAGEAEAFCRWLRHTVRLMGASLGVMQEGHIRFEPNINCVLTLEGGAEVVTPIVEVKNLNSFRAVVGAIEYERRAQVERWREDGREMGPGAKRTFGWDDANQRTVAQREKEDAHDYRYFPDPDLPPVRVDAAMVERGRSIMGEVWLERVERLVGELGLSIGDATVVLDDWWRAKLFEAAHRGLVEQGVEAKAAARGVANLLTQKMAGVHWDRPDADGRGRFVDARMVAEIVALRLAEKVSSNGADALVEAICTSDHRGEKMEALAERMDVLIVQDDAAIDAWCRAAIKAHPQAAEEVRGGKAQAIGRLIGHAMQAAGGSGDPKAIRGRLLELLGG
ncbi:MAG: Asp-tRNA(Asn)/Glu-tRNA(Gln) amidotransferase subunit GatB [Phycisphaerales bacterium]